jgi:hypothetical protein
MRGRGYLYIVCHAFEGERPAEDCVWGGSARVRVRQRKGREALFLGGGQDKAGGDVMPCHASWGFFPFCERERGWILRYLIFGYFSIGR